MSSNLNIPDIINIIAVSQLLFFALLLIFRSSLNSRAGKLLLTFLILQALSYGNYFLYRFGTEDLFLIYLVTVPAAFLVTPVYFRYIKTWLFNTGEPIGYSWLHSLPAIISFLLVVLDNMHDRIKVLQLDWLDKFPVFNTAQHVQILCYNIAAVFLIRKYKVLMESRYSSNNLASIGWIRFLVYSYISATTIVGALEIIFPLNNIINYSYILYWIFLNLILSK